MRKLEPYSVWLVHEFFPERYDKHDFSRFEDSRYADNYQLRFFVGEFTEIGQKPGKQLTRHDLEVAKARLRQFSLIMIVEFFDATTQLMVRPSQYASGLEKSSLPMSQD